ncbi:hypothetical protein HPG69_019012 [Diceros bicornis minor]|uniref:G-protein coupled receptors family 3 profile domain-containing protein n=1 Tax=Diceros bicornis minor TaxID=77932 RepID=A0A7J7FH44_DICBM|nr:hypothetical protein HPG69_019012 [Diceros bicornis minor]
MTAVYPSAFRLPDLTTTYQAYLAAKALLATYHNLMSYFPGEGPFLGGTCAKAQNDRPWQGLHYAQKVHFTTRAQTEIFFTKYGEMLTTFDIKNMYILPDQKGQTTIVGHFDFRAPPREELLISDSTIIWGEGLLKPLGTVLAVCTALVFLLALAILGIFIWHHHTPIVRANNHQLSYLLLSSLALSFLGTFMFIGHPGPFTYAVRQAAFGVTFTICVSTVLAKAIVVVAAFHATS